VREPNVTFTTPLTSSKPSRLLSSTIAVLRASKQFRPGEEIFVDYNKSNYANTHN